jgi:hypothetical protein
VGVIGHRHSSLHTGEGTLGEIPGHSFDAYGARTEGEEPHHDFEQGRRSDATGFFYTQQHYDEQMAFQNYVDTSLAHNEQNWIEQRQWNQNTTQTMATIREGQDQVNSILNSIFAFLQIPKED